MVMSNAEKQRRFRARLRVRMKRLRYLERFYKAYEEWAICNDVMEQFADDIRSFDDEFGFKDSYRSDFEPDKAGFSRYAKLSFEDSGYVDSDSFKELNKNVRS